MPSVDGIVSGIDTTGLINAIVGASAGTKYVLLDQLDAYEEKADKVAGIKNRLDDLVGVIEGFDEVDEFPAFTATTSAGTGDENAVSASVAEGAVPGTYAISVTSLAQSESEVSDGFADFDTTAVVSSGTYNIVYGGDSSTITIDSDSYTLEGLAEQLDGVDGLTSYVLDTGASSDPYKLVVMGEATGATNTVDLSSLGITFTETISAQDAKIDINGVTIYSDINSVNSAVPGMEIDLASVTTAAVSVTVVRDDEAMSQKMQDFVNGYNTVIDYYKTNTLYDSEKEIKGALVGDSTVRGIIEGLASMVGAQYDLGFDFESLGQLGISTTQDGTLSYTSSDFEDLLESDYSNVVSFLTDTSGPLNSIRDRIEDVYVDPYEGTIKTRTDSLEDTIEGLEDSIADFEARMEDYEARLRTQFNSMEIVLGELYSTQSYLTALFAQGASTK